MTGRFGVLFLCVSAFFLPVWAWAEDAPCERAYQGVLEGAKRPAFRSDLLQSKVMDRLQADPEVRDLADRLMEVKGDSGIFDGATLMAIFSTARRGSVAVLSIDTIRVKTKSQFVGIGMHSGGANIGFAKLLTSIVAASKGIFSKEASVRQIQIDANNIHNDLLFRTLTDYGFKVPGGNAIAPGGGRNLVLEFGAEDLQR